MNQNNFEAIMNLVNLGKMSIEEANIEMVRSERVRVISKLPQDTRKQLNNAVKNGLLAHKKKEGHKPEVYYHPDFEHIANIKRNEIAERALKSILSICAV